MSYTKEQAVGMLACASANNYNKIPEDALYSMKAALLAFPDVLEALIALEEAARCVQAQEWDRNSIQIERMQAQRAIAKAKGE